MDLTIIAAMNETGIPERLNFRGFWSSRKRFSKHYVEKKKLFEIVKLECSIVNQRII